MRLVERAVVVGTMTGLALAMPGCGGENEPVQTQAQPTPAPQTDTAPQLQPQTGPALGAPRQGTLSCEAKDADKWQPTPSHLNAERIAAAIGGVTAEQVVDGSWGPAICEEGILASEAGTKISVQGIGSKCVAIGVDSPPEEGKIYNNVLAVCAAPENAGQY